MSEGVLRRREDVALPGGPSSGFSTKKMGSTTSLTSSTSKKQHMVSIIRKKRPLEPNLDFSGMFLKGRQGAEQFAKFATAEHDYGLVTDLDLSYNTFGPEGLRDINTVLGQFKNLGVLKFENNSVNGTTTTDKDAVKEFPNCFKDMENLKSIYLERNNFGLNVVGGASLGALLQNVRGSVVNVHLQHNKLGYTEDGFKSVIEALSNCPKLMILDLSNNFIIGSKCAAQLDKFRSASVRTLELSDNALGCDGARSLVEPLKSMSDLRTLHLSNNDFGSEGAKLIAEALKHIGNSLKNLFLSGNNFGCDEGAEAIAGALNHRIKEHGQQLNQLDLSSNNFGSSGAEKFVECLKLLTDVNTLNLASNGFGTRGIKTLEPAFANKKKMKNLNLSYNHFGTGGLPYVTSILKALPPIFRIFHLGSNALFGRKGTQDTEHIEKVHDEFMAELAKKTNLQKLYLPFNDLGPEGGKKLTSAIEKLEKKLEVLDLSSNSLGSGGTTDFANILVKMKKLNTLNLSRNQLGLEGIEKFKPSKLSHIQTLDLSSNSLGMNEGTVEAMTQAITLPPAATTSTNTMALITLNLSCNYIGVNGGVNHLEQVLKSHSSTLEALYLSSNNIGQHTKIYIAISTIKGLKTLDLSANGLGATKKASIAYTSGAAGASAAAKSGDGTAMEIDDADVPMEEDTGTTPEDFFAESLEKLENLMYLNLASNQFGRLSFEKMIQHAFKNKKKLSHVNLSYNKLGEVGKDYIDQFADIVTGDLDALSELNLLCNGLQGDGGSDDGPTKMDGLKEKFKDLKNNLGIIIRMSNYDDDDDNENDPQQKAKKKKPRMTREELLQKVAAAKANRSRRPMPSQPIPTPAAVVKTDAMDES